MSGSISFKGIGFVFRDADKRTGVPGIPIDTLFGINYIFIVNKKAHIEYWIAGARHDLIAMENLFSCANYDWALFVGHLVLEKALKARWLWDNKNDAAIPPKTHLLDKLAKETSIHFDEATLVWLVQANDFNLETRYPDYKMEFYKRASREFAQENIDKIKDVLQCILKTMH